MSVLLGAVAVAFPAVATYLVTVAALAYAGVAAVRARIFRWPAAADKAAMLEPELDCDAEREMLEDRIWALSDQEARCRHLVDLQQDIIWRRDRDGRVTFVNRAFCQTFGVSWETVVGTTFRPPVLACGGQRGVVGEAGHQQLLTIEGPRWFDWSRTKLPAMSADREEEQCVGRDVTDQREYAEALTHARNAADAANQAKSRFLANMSHEIRTPLNGIVGLSRLLAGTQLDQRQTEYASALVKSADTLHGLVENILDFSRIEAGRISLGIQPYAPRDLVNDAVELVQAKANAKGLAIEVDFAGNVPAQSAGDVTRIRQILVNLLDNAIKSTFEGQVRVRVVVEDAELDARFIETVKLPADQSAKRAKEKPHRKTDIGNLVFHVTDTGIGFGGVNPERLFREFEQARTARVSNLRARGATGSPLPREGGGGSGASDVAGGCMQPEAPPEGVGFDGVACDGAALDSVGLEGAGLGLAICRRLVTAMGGSVTARQRASGGAHFRVRLPLEPLTSTAADAGLKVADPPERSTADIESGPADRSQRRVLLIEDNAVNALVASACVERLGFVCEVCKTGEAGVDALLNVPRTVAPPVAVLLDLRLPDIDGYDVLSRLQAAWAINPPAQRPAVIALTANAFTEDRDRCAAAGFTAFLTKPFDPADLAKVLPR